MIASLQTAIGPAILISGTGLLLLTMTNRLARVIDRARSASLRVKQADERQQAQLDILLKRARCLQIAILCASISALGAVCLIGALFVTALLKTSCDGVMSVLFLASLGFLAASLGFFIRDVNQSLKALWLDVT